MAKGEDLIEDLKVEVVGMAKDGARILRPSRC